MINKVAFTGPFSDINFGDYAMLINNIYDIDCKNITLFSYDDQFLNEISSAYLSMFNIDIINIDLTLPQAMLSNANIINPELISKLIRNKKQIEEILKSVDVLVVNGGGYFNELWSQPHRIERLVKIIAPIIIASDLNIKIVFTGNSFGPFKDHIAFFSNFINYINTNVLHTRDRLNSPLWIKSLSNYYKKEINFIPDDLLVLNKDLIESKQNYSLPKRKYIVLETYLSEEYIKSNIRVFESFINYFNLEKDFDIVLLPFHTNYGGFKQLEFLKSQFSQLKLFDINKKGYLPIEQARILIDKAELVISNRYHALILALGCKTPIISVLKDVLGNKDYYYNKDFGAIKELIKLPQEEHVYYLQNDYSEALKFAINNFKALIEKQNRNYGENYSRKYLKLKKLRENLINEIVKGRDI